MAIKTIKRKGHGILERVNRWMYRSGIKSSRRPKVFGIGRNKTGTTSLQQALESFGYRVAPTRLGERLLPFWIDENYEPILELCREFDAFQDIPFSLPCCYKVLDSAFPDSKFVLTVRDSAEQWYQSLTSFHAKKFGQGRLPNWEDLETSQYRYPGFIAQCQRHIYHADQVGLYNEVAYKQHYLEHNQAVRDYFCNRSGDFLELNVAASGAYESLCQFLGIESEQSDFPWVNRTVETS